jgi:hypothetical protein
MASTTDSRASAFDAAAFRDAIRFAMDMGLPETTADRATFKWTPVKTYANADTGGRPYKLTEAAASTTTHSDVQIPVGWQFVPTRVGNEQQTAMGSFDNDRVIMTILDEDYDQVKGADICVLGGDDYIVDYVAPPDGLFEVTIYTLYLTARDES